MKIMLAIKGLSEAGGGTERIVVDLAKYLTRNNHDVSILTFDMLGSSSFYPIDDRVKRLDIGIGDTRRKSGITDTFRRIFAMRQVIFIERPDIVVGFMHSMYVPLAVSLIGTRFPVVGSEHIVPQHYETRRLEYLLVHLSTFLIDRFTVLSATIQESYGRLFRRKAIVMPNPVKNPELNKTQKNLTGKILLSVGRLEEQKDQITLIKAFSRIASQFPDWNLRIIGEGSLISLLENQIETLNLDDRIALPGATSEIDTEYANADIFVLPSLYESFRLVTAEAMSYGLPPIGFEDCPGTNELIQDGVNGMLVNSSNRVRNLADAMVVLIENQKLRATLGEQGKLTVASFSPTIIFAKWEDFLNEIVQGNPHPQTKG